ncbi:cytochrome P450 [Phellopilus nigrolimitatus]|nr:cytochrome P450 [Phellopilus nigrolimitatus]
MLLSEPAVQVLAVGLGTYALWRFLSFLFVKNPLSKIPGPPKVSWLKGNFDQVYNKDGWEFHRKLYEDYGGAVRVDMFLGDQQLFVSDPLALYHILIKDQQVFEETDTFLMSFKVTFGKSLLSTLGEEHKRQRKMLNPVFNLKHMRDLLPIFHPIAHKLTTVLEREVSKGKEHINVMTWVSRAALEYIGQGGLGYSFDALDEQETNMYSETMKNFVRLLFRLSLPRTYLSWVVNLGSPEFRRRVLDVLNHIPLFGPMKELTVFTDTLEECSRGILHGKQQALAKGDEAMEEQAGKGKDIMSVLLKATIGVDGSSLPESELLAHMSTFIFAGHDTTTSAICRTLDVLCHRPDVQSRLREEVTTARKERDGADLDYDALMSLPYLDAVCRETLRVFPPATQVDRITKKDVVVPLAFPLQPRDGKPEIKEVMLKKNTTVIISILGANRSKAIWGDDANEWKPERWLQPLPESVARAHLPGVYSQMMTFLGGGRACIGFKFSEMELKLVLSVLLERFVFAPGPEINWEMSGLHSPILKNSEDRSPQLPLKVTLVGNKCC